VELVGTAETVHCLLSGGEVQKDQAGVHNDGIVTENIPRILSEKVKECDRVDTGGEGGGGDGE
jgi:hypothetical protein